MHNLVNYPTKLTMIILLLIFLIRCAGALRIETGIIGN